MRQPPFVRRVLSLLLVLLCAGSTVHTAAETRIEGVVLYHDSTLGLFVQVGEETVQVVGMDGTLSPGDHVSVAGTAAEKDGRRTLSAARVHLLAAGSGLIVTETVSNVLRASVT